MFITFNLTSAPQYQYRRHLLMKKLKIYINNQQNLIGEPHKIHFLHII